MSGQNVFEQMVGTMQTKHTPLRTWSGKLIRKNTSNGAETLFGKPYTACVTDKVFVIDLACMTITCFITQAM